MNRAATLVALVLFGSCAASRAASAGVPQTDGPLGTPNWSHQITDAKPSSTAAAATPAFGTDRLRLSLDFLGGYGGDSANATLGFEQQGRVGFATLTAQGRLGSRVSYLVSMNPVDETESLPACAAAGFFFPNDPKILYGADSTIPCQPKNGDRRVDAYRGIALDLVPQQGALREAYADLQLTPRFRVRFGRTRIPIGFDWEEAGSITAKDAPMIQRIDARASFGLLMSYRRDVIGRARPLWTATLGAYLGEGNRFLDYDFFYFEDGSLDSNSAVTGLIAGSFAPVTAVEVRGSYQHGYTGSRVERLPSYWASKRNDDALVLSVAIRPWKYLRVLAEQARYTWGPTASSAEIVGASPDPIQKSGGYVTAESEWPVHAGMSFGVSATRERIQRNDSLISFAIAQGLFGVTPGSHDTMSVFRAFLDIHRQIRIGFYRNWDHDPYPWLSGIMPVSGPGAFTGRGTDKWGVTVRLSVW